MNELQLKNEVNQMDNNCTNGIAITNLEFLNGDKKDELRKKQKKSKKSKKVIFLGFNW